MSRTRFVWFVLVLFSFPFSFSVQSLASDKQVMMIAKVVNSGTTVSQAVFFTSQNVNTLDQCNEEKAIGLQYGWREFNHTLNTGRGGFQVLYQCVESDAAFSPFRGSRGASGHKYVYLISINDNVASVEAMSSYADCIGRVRSAQGEESRYLFCGKSSQSMM